MKYLCIIPCGELMEQGAQGGQVVELDETTAKQYLTVGAIEVLDEDKYQADLNAEKAFEVKELKGMIKAQTAEIKKSIMESMGIKDVKMLAHMQELAEVEKKRKEEKENRFKCLGENIQAIAAALGIEFNAGAKAKALAKKSMIHRAIKAPTGQGESVNADGGFLVDVEFDRVLDQRLMETGILVSRTDSREIGEGFNGMKWNGLIDYDRTDTNHAVQVFYTAEADAKTAAKWTLERLTLSLLKLAALNYLTDELLQDTRNLEQDVMEWFNNEFGWKIDNGIFEGAGGTAITGILAHASNIPVVRSGGAASGVADDDVRAMYSRLWTTSKSNPNTSWYINPDVAPDLQGMTIGDQPVYLPPGGLSTSPFGTLMGKPVVELEHCKSVATLGDINLWDLSQYRYISKGGTQVDVSDIPRFINDETVMRFVKRANGIPKWTTVQTPQNGSNTVSPFVSLATGV